MREPALQAISAFFGLEVLTDLPRRLSVALWIAHVVEIQIFLVLDEVR